MVRVCPATLSKLFSTCSVWPLSAWPKLGSNVMLKGALAPPWAIAPQFCAVTPLPDSPALSMPEFCSAPRRLGPPVPTLWMLNSVVKPPRPTRMLGKAMLALPVPPPCSSAPDSVCCVRPAARIKPLPLTAARRSKLLPMPKLALS